MRLIENRIQLKEKSNLDIIKNNSPEMIYYQDDNYLILKDDNYDPTRISLWYEGINVGNLYTSSYTSKDNNKYYKIKAIEIQPKHRGKGLATKMYSCLKDSASTYKGIVSYLPDRVNKKQIPKIWSKFNSYIEEDYEIIEFNKKENR